MLLAALFLPVGPAAASPALEGQQPGLFVAAHEDQRAPGSAVGLAVDWRRLATVSRRDGLALPEVLQQLQAAGVQGVVIPEQTLAGLAEAGHLQVRWGWQVLAEERQAGKPLLPPTLTGEQGAGPFQGVFKPWRFIIMPATASTARWLHESLQQRWPGRVESFTTLEGDPWLAVSVPRENPVETSRRHGAFHRYLFPVDEEKYPHQLMNLPLGFWPADFSTVQAAGLRIMPQVSGLGAADQPETLLGPAADLPPETVLLLGQPGLPPAAVADWARFLQAARWHLGLVAGTAPGGQEELAHALPQQLIKVHKVWPEETDGDLVRRVTQGHSQILLFDSFMTLTGRPDDAGHWDGKAAANLAAKLAAVGPVDWPQPLGSSGGPGLPAWLPALGGAGPLSRWLMLGCLLGLPLLATALAAGFTWRSRPEPDPTPSSRGGPADTAVVVPAWRAATGLVLAVLLVAGGGLLLATLQNHPLVLSGVMRWRLVDLAPVVSLALAAALPLLARRWPRLVPWELSAATLSGRRQPAAALPPAGDGLLRRPISFGTLLAAVFLGLLVALAWLRSTGLPLAPVDPKAPAGMGWREVLLFLPVPFLELLLTMPPLLLALLAGRQRALSGWRPLMLAGLFGLASLLAALVRVQIPWPVTWSAAALGLAAGLLLGISLHLLSRYGQHWLLQDPVPARLAGSVQPTGGALSSGGNR